MSKEYLKNYYQEHRDAIRKQQKEYYQKNREKVREQAAVYRKKSVEHKREHDAAYYVANKERRAAYHKYWRSKNQTKVLILHSKRRALKRQAEGTWTQEEWESLKETHDFSCLCCRKAEPIIKLVADHVIPLSRGGSNRIDNIQPLCVKCNNKKYVKTTDYR